MSFWQIVDLILIAGAVWYFCRCWYYERGIIDTFYALETQAGRAELLFTHDPREFIRKVKGCLL